MDQSKGRVLDNDLLKEFEEICEDIEINLKNENSEIERSLPGIEAGEGPKIDKKPGRLERRKNDNIMDVIGAGLSLLDRNLNIILANRTICEWLDLEKSPVGSTCHDIYHCYEIGEGKCPTVKVFEGEDAHIIEAWITNKDKRKRCLQHITTPITNNEGTVENVLILTVDVTERAKLVHWLLLLQQLGEIMQGTLHLDKLLHLILTCVTAGYAFGFNRALLFMINKEQNVLNGKLAVGPSSLEEANRIWKEMSTKYNSLTDFIEELDHIHNIDNPLNIKAKLMAFPLNDRNEVVATCVKTKMTIIVRDASNDLRVSEDFKNALGVNEFVCVPLIIRNEPKGVIVADNIYTGEPITEDLVNILTMFANQAVLAIENAETYNRLEDKVKQLADTQQILMRSERLVTIGTMASYIAHEIRNPLVTIGGFAKSLSKHEFSDPKIRKNVDIIHKEVVRLEKILNNITDFSKPLVTEKYEVRICDIMNDIRTLMGNYLSDNNINFHLEIGPDIPKIMADPNQIKQVLLNMLMNSVESIAQGGDITIKINSIKKTIKINVIDTGKGIPKKVLKNIFDPFFTTKSDGTGVGLAVSHNIIKDHGGKINAKSEPGKGTTMTLTLPVT